MTYFSPSVAQRNASADRLNAPGGFYNPYAGYDLESRINVLLLEFSYRSYF